jgi:P-type E1-E2 ATPase
MIGDGANDCAAISQAHVGISFCTSDASYTAPFASQDTSINCLITILKEGRQNTITISVIFMFLVSSFCMQNIGRCILIAETQGIGTYPTTFR